MEPLSIFFILIPIAILTGIIAAMIGIGGGILMVPILGYLVFEYLVDPLPVHPDFIMAYVTTISSTVIIFTGLSGSIAFGIQKRVDFLVGSISAVFSVCGAILGKWLQNLFDNTVLIIIFAVLLVVTSIRMIYKVYTSYKNKKTKQETEQKNRETTENTNSKTTETKIENLEENNSEKKSFTQKLTLTRVVSDNCNETWDYNAKLYLTPMAFLGGFVAGIAGLGGGVVMVPILHIVIGLPIHFATATSAFIMIFSSISAVTTAAISLPFELTGMWWPHVAGLAIGIIIGTQIGAQIAKRMKADPLKLVFAIALVAAGIWSIIKVTLL